MVSGSYQRIELSSSTFRLYGLRTERFVEAHVLIGKPGVGFRSKSAVAPAECGKSRKRSKEIFLDLISVIQEAAYTSCIDTPSHKGDTRAFH